MELLVVLLVIAVLAGMLVPLIGRNMKIKVFTGEEKTFEEIGVEESLIRLRETILGSPDKPGYFDDMNRLPRPGALGMGSVPARKDHPQLRYLFIDPKMETASRSFDIHTRTGWRGPYIVSPVGQYIFDPRRGFLDLYGETGDAAVIDLWGNPIVIQNLGSVEYPSWYLVSAGPDKHLGLKDDNVSLLLQEELPQEEP